MNIVFDVAAQEDLADIHAYYEQQREGLGDRFVVHFRRGIEQILRFPDAWAPIGEGRRRYQISTFPYGIIFRVDEKASEIKVSAIVHLHSDPKNWRRG